MVMGRYVEIDAWETSIPSGRGVIVLAGVTTWDERLESASESGMYRLRMSV